MKTDGLRVGIVTENSPLHSALTGILLENFADQVRIDHIFIVRRHLRNLYAIITDHRARKQVKNMLLTRLFSPGTHSGIPLGFSGFNQFPLLGRHASLTVNASEADVMSSITPDE